MRELRRLNEPDFDHLAAQFENLRMTEDESITDFSAKLSSIAHEATVLGKEYKDKKLVKK